MCISYIGSMGLAMTAFLLISCTHFSTCFLTYISVKDAPPSVAPRCLLTWEVIWIQVSWKISIALIRERADHSGGRRRGDGRHCAGYNIVGVVARSAAVNDEARGVAAEDAHGHHCK